MSFEVYVLCLGDESAWMPRSAVRSLFPVVDAESEQDYWFVRYDDHNACHIRVSPLASDQETLKSLCVHRPCADSRLWESLLRVLQMHPVVMYWPGGPAIVAEPKTVALLPRGLAEALGPPKVVGVADELLSLLQET